MTCIMMSFLLSAGVGQTGTFLCIDMLMKRIKEGEKNIDIFNFIRQLRFRRERTVETPVSVPYKL